MMSVIQAYRIESEKVLDEMTKAYFFGGAGHEVTLGNNQNIFQTYKILPCVLKTLRGGNASTSILGERLSHPIIVAPIAYQRLAHRDGEIATAMAASAQNAKMVLSSQASIKMEDVHNAGPTCDWFQLYWQVSRENTLALVKRAEVAGYKAIVMTVDAPINGVRDREQKVGFRLPQGISAVNLAGIPQPLFEPLGDGESAIFDRFMQVAPDWNDVEWLCSHTNLPVILKGILRPSDAIKAMNHGAQGIVVSNHGGRVLDGVPTAIEMLPAIRQAVKGNIPIIVDGGIRRGTDILIALALGANAVMVGRPIIWGLAANGAEGVSHVLRILIDEFEIAMALSGCRNVSDITPDLLI